MKRNSFSRGITGSVLIWAATLSAARADFCHPHTGSYTGDLSGELELYQEEQFDADNGLYYMTVKGPIADMAKGPGESFRASGQILHETDINMQWSAGNFVGHFKGTIVNCGFEGTYEARNITDSSAPLLTGTVSVPGNSDSGSAPASGTNDSASPTVNPGGVAICGQGASLTLVPMLAVLMVSRRRREGRPGEAASQGRSDQAGYSRSSSRVKGGQAR